jgi:hypothetical protein
MRECPMAILIAVDQNIEDMQNKTDKVLSLEGCKSEADLIK